MARTDKGMGIESVCVWRSGPIVSSSQRWGKKRKNREGEPSSPAFLWVPWLSLTTNVNPYPCATVVNLHEELVVYFSSTPQ